MMSSSMNLSQMSIYFISLRALEGLKNTFQYKETKRYGSSAMIASVISFAVARIYLRRSVEVIGLSVIPSCVSELSTIK
jgi:hypothetical protein